MVDKKLRVRFLADRRVLDHEGNTLETFEAGKCYTLAWASAQRWLRREAAEIAPPAKPKREKPASTDETLDAG